MWNKRKPFCILVIAVGDAVLKFEAEVLLDRKQCFEISKISKVLVSAFDRFAVGGGDPHRIDQNIALEIGLVPVLARICSILLRTDYEARQCLSCLLDFRVFVGMIGPIAARFWHSATEWRIYVQGPPSTRMLLIQFPSYVTEVVNRIDIFVGC